MQERRRAAVRRRLAGFVFAAAVLVMVLGVSGFTPAGPDPASYCYYDAVLVGRNDTLWGIAQEHYTRTCGSMKQYLKEIRGLNHMKGDTIYVGQTIIVPYYVTAAE